MAESERVESGDLQRTAPQALAVSATQRAGLGDVAKRVGALVAVSRGVFRAAASDGIEHDQDGASHGFLPLSYGKGVDGRGSGLNRRFPPTVKSPDVAPARPWPATIT